MTRRGPSTSLRTGDWEQALNEYFAACERRAYAWGSHDCLLFAAGAELAMTGADPAAEIRGRYRSQAGAMRLLKERGFATIEAAVDAHKPEVPVGFAHRGDWVLHEGAIGVSAGRVALFVGDIALRQAQDDREEVWPGLIRLPRSAWQKAWAIGRPTAALPEGGE